LTQTSPLVPFASPIKRKAWKKPAEVSVITGNF
jgi:hypothetical protein